MEYYFFSQEEFINSHSAVGRDCALFNKIIDNEMMYTLGIERLWSAWSDYIRLSYYISFINSLPVRDK
eukprot:snap_masked-scaffold_14-processed-gene-5.19-mRNA-1 protein AED:1.00 eAED:1.00 QI:0/0/0/0/1/1/3/0/67